MSSNPESLYLSNGIAGRSGILDLHYFNRMLFLLLLLLTFLLFLVALILLVMFTPAVSVR